MRFKITIEYDGTNTLGWQRQLDGPSIQEYIETAISCFCGKLKTSAEYNPYKKYGKEPHCLVQCAGRTDAGVHALGQVAHFDLDKNIDEWKLREGINAHLRNAEAPTSILNVEKVEDDFNARFSAKKRSYIYKILNRRAFSVLNKNRVWWVPTQLNVQKMQEDRKSCV